MFVLSGWWLIIHNHSPFHSRLEKYSQGKLPHVTSSIYIDVIMNFTWYTITSQYSDACWQQAMLAYITAVGEHHFSNKLVYHKYFIVFLHYSYYFFTTIVKRIRMREQWGSIQLWRIPPRYLTLKLPVRKKPDTPATLHLRLTLAGSWMWNPIDRGLHQPVANSLPGIINLIWCDFTLIVIAGTSNCTWKFFDDIMSLSESLHIYLPWAVGDKLFLLCHHFTQG